MKSYISHFIGALIAYYSTDLLSESVFSAVIAPVFLLGFVFMIFVKLYLRFFGEPMYTKPTKGEKKAIKALFGNGRAYRNLNDD